MNDRNVDHLFRHEFGKMVSILTRIFGLQHLETIEDAVQDTFIKALKSWRMQEPDDPGAWLMKSAKNRCIDLLRKIKSDQGREMLQANGASSYSIDEAFSPEKIQDSVLRMIFTACHPKLDSRDQIAFSLRTLSGFSRKEISSALLIKEETIKKRLTRARKQILEQGIPFQLPEGPELSIRLNRVLEVVYLIFNEGFHSNRTNILVRQDLCLEAMRLNKLLLGRPEFRKPNVFALLALMCFHAARLSSKQTKDGSILDIRQQDRTQWDRRLIYMGDHFMNQAVEKVEQYSAYHIEAAIASEHLSASTYERTPWNRILDWYLKLYNLHPTASTALNLAIVHLQLNQIPDAKTWLDRIDPQIMGLRAYLYYATLGECYIASQEPSLAKENFQKAIDLANNQAEKTYLAKKYLH